jgi:hypothetical protein
MRFDRPILDAFAVVGAAIRRSPRAGRTTITVREGCPRGKEDSSPVHQRINRPVEKASVQVYSLLYACREISAVLRRPAQESLSSRSSRRRGLAPKSKLLAHFSKTEREVICTMVAVAVSYAMFSARFDRGAMSAADQSYLNGHSANKMRRRSNRGGGSCPGLHEHHRKKYAVERVDDLKIIRSYRLKVGF